MIQEQTSTPYKMLRLLYILGSDGAPRNMVSSGLADSWGVELYQLIDSTSWLLQEEYIQKGTGSYYITAMGREAYELACEDSTLHQFNYYQFVNEALTGLTPRGDRSRINRAALPGSATPARRQRQESGMMGMLAKELDMSIDQVVEGLLSKQVKLCAHCSKFKQAEQFHKNKSTTDGRHAYCKHCRKIKAKGK